MSALQSLFVLLMLGLHVGLGAVAAGAFYRRRVEAMVEARMVAVLRGLELQMEERERVCLESGRRQGANEMAAKAMLAGLRSN